jgi:hypothetical protein
MHKDKKLENQLKIDYMVDLAKKIENKRVEFKNEFIELKKENLKLGRRNLLLEEINEDLAE